MNTKVLFVLATAVVMAAPVASVAQLTGQEPHGITWEQRLRLDYFDDDQSTNPMPSMKHLKAAEMALHSALPIYQSYRLRAALLIRRAHEAAEQGGTATSITEPMAEQPLPMARTEGADISKYSSDELRQSQDRMKEAMVELHKALSSMGQVGGGATSDIRLALVDVRNGMDLHPGISK